MRPVVRGSWPLDAEGEQKEFAKYQNARKDLIDRLGGYCSYCEMKIDASLAVEHIQPKSHHPSLTFDWNNFLLACPNCNSNKGKKNIALNDYIWPDRDNTFRALDYQRGIVKSKPNIEETKANRLIQLVGLDKIPNPINTTDRRWLSRLEAWDMAERAKHNLNRCYTNQMNIHDILDTAKAQGYWSIWMTQFRNDPNMLKRFIDDFPGTCTDCFDTTNHCSPIPRVGGVC
jgi:uncharacterized protein (TIGR02646 family)